MNNAEWRCPECETINTTESCIICGFKAKDLVSEPHVAEKKDNSVDLRKFDNAANVARKSTFWYEPVESKEKKPPKERNYSLIAHIGIAVGILTACPLLMWLLASL